MKIAYFDCFAGISGDMTLGALVDAGADQDALRWELGKLPVSEYELSFEKVIKRGIAATKAIVVLKDTKHFRKLEDIEKIISDSELPERVRGNALCVFRRLAEAEAKVHKISVSEVHFHEVGAVDAIVDVVGACIGLELLGVEQIFGSALPYPRGCVETSHGKMPIPAPATAELLIGAPTYGVDMEAELVTPTGAAILTTLAISLGPCPPMRVSGVGYGAGSMDLSIVNALRIVIGEFAQPYADGDRVAQIETNLDDLNPQFYEVAVERLFAAGALDVFLTPIQMKKSRPGTLLTVLCRPEATVAISDVLFTETSTLGLRIAELSRLCLPREWKTVQTKYGEIRVKVGLLGNGMQTFSPEYEDCKAAAAQYGTPVKTVYDAAVAAYLAGR